MDKWCIDHCAIGDCPPTHCTCSSGDVIVDDDTGGQAGNVAWDLGASYNNNGGAGAICESYVAREPFRGNMFVDQFCQASCSGPNGNCLSDVCECQSYGQDNVIVCQARDANLAQYPQINVFCAQWCSMGWCPSEDCVCN